MSASPVSCCLSLSLLETREHSNKMVFTTLQNNKTLRASEVSIHFQDQASHTGTPQNVFQIPARLHRHCFLLHRGWKPQLTRQKAVLMGTSFLVLYSHCPHVSLSVVSTKSLTRASVLHTGKDSSTTRSEPRQTQMQSLTPCTTWLSWYAYRLFYGVPHRLVTPRPHQSVEMCFCY